MSQLPGILRFLLGKFGLPRAITITTLILMAVSVAMTASMMLLMELSSLRIGIALAAICPLIVTPPVAGFYLTMIQRLDRANAELGKALAEVKELKGMLPICSSCKKIRDDAGYWNHIESYIAAHSKAEFTHSICPDCSKNLYGEFLS